MKVGIEPDVALLQLEKGEIQLMGDPPPGADWTRITGDPAWKNRIEVEQTVNTTYIAININDKPFDNVKVRQAFNYAIDKAAYRAIVEWACHGRKSGPAAAHAGLR